MICNHLGSDKALRNLHWNGDTAWRNAPQGVYLVNGHVAGYIKESANLASLLVLHSGHMVPLDLPHIALDFFARFLSVDIPNKKMSFSAGNSKLSGSSTLPTALQCMTKSESGNHIHKHKSSSTQHRMSKRGSYYSTTSNSDLNHDYDNSTSTSTSSGSLYSKTSLLMRKKKGTANNVRKSNNKDLEIN